jgi:predicted enzyme related to lactoylglutathione lyase
MSAERGTRKSEVRPEARDGLGHSADQIPRSLVDGVAYCVIYVADLAGMAHFYGEVLGLEVAEQNERFVAFGGAGVPLALEAGGPPVEGPRAKDRNPTLVQFAVGDIETSVVALSARGVAIEGAIRRGAFGALAFFRDPEGNRLALLERRPPQPPNAGGSTSGAR